MTPQWAVALGPGHPIPAGPWGGAGERKGRAWKMMSRSSSLLQQPPAAATREDAACTFLCQRGGSMGSAPHNHRELHQGSGRRQHFKKNNPKIPISAEGKQRSCCWPVLPRRDIKFWRLQHDPSRLCTPVPGQGRVCPHPAAHSPCSAWLYPRG